MHIYRTVLILFHLASAACYFPHLITHMLLLSFRSLSWPSRIAFMAYWLNYSFVVLGMLGWCLWIVGHQRTTWQVIHVSGLLLIGKLVYTTLDVTTRILLGHSSLVIGVDLVHLVLLSPAICVTFLLVQRVKRSTEASQQAHYIELDLDG